MPPTGPIVNRTKPKQQKLQRNPDLDPYLDPYLERIQEHLADEKFKMGHFSLLSGSTAKKLLENTYNAISSLKKNKDPQSMDKGTIDQLIQKCHRYMREHSQKSEKVNFIQDCINALNFALGYSVETAEATTKNPQQEYPNGMNPFSAVVEPSGATAGATAGATHQEYPPTSSNTFNAVVEPSVATTKNPQQEYPNGMNPFSDVVEPLGATHQEYPPTSSNTFNAVVEPSGATAGATQQEEYPNCNNPFENANAGTSSTNHDSIPTLISLLESAGSLSKREQAMINSYNESKLSIKAQYRSDKKAYNTQKQELRREHNQVIIAVEVPTDICVLRQLKELTDGEGKKSSQFANIVNAIIDLKNRQTASSNPKTLYDEFKRIRKQILDYKGKNNEKEGKKWRIDILEKIASGEVVTREDLRTQPRPAPTETQPGHRPALSLLRRAKEAVVRTASPSGAGSSSTSSGISAAEADRRKGIIATLNEKAQEYLRNLRSKAPKKVEEDGKSDYAKILREILNLCNKPPTDERCRHSSTIRKLIEKYLEKNIGTVGKREHCQNLQNMYRYLLDLEGKELPNSFREGQEQAQTIDTRSTVLQIVSSDYDKSKNVMRQGKYTKLLETVDDYLTVYPFADKNFHSKDAATTCCQHMIKIVHQAKDYKKTHDISNATPEKKERLEKVRIIENYFTEQLLGMRRVKKPFLTRFTKFLKRIVVGVIFAVVLVGGIGLGLIKKVIRR